MRFFISILFVTILFSCSSNTSTDTSKTEKIETSATKTESEKKSLNQAETGKYQFLTFKGAKALSKTTTYTFADENDKLVSIQISNNPELAKVKVPASLKNEDMIGTKVEWIYEHKSDNVVEVKIIK